MELKLYIILLAYFSIGAVIIFAINRNKPMAERKKNWLKYFVYLFNINLLFGSIYFNKIFFHYISIAIISFGFFEIIRVTVKTRKVITGIFTLFAFSFLAYAFFSFSLLSRQYIFYTFFVITVFDAFSQITGQLLGKRKLLPNISPNKTIEGFFGGFSFSVFTSFMIRDLLGINEFQSIALGFGISLFAFTGGGLASCCKRKFEI